MKILLLFLFSLSSLADTSSMQLIAYQLEINDSYIQNEFQKNVEKNKLDDELISLIEQNELLKEDYTKKSEETLKSECDRKKKKKKKKNEEKKGGWVIGAIVEFKTPLAPHEQYEMLYAPLNTFEYDALYEKWLEADSLDTLQQTIQAQTQNMTRSEYLSFIGEMMSRLPYNYDKQKMKQSEQHVDSLWSMIEEEKKAYANQPGFQASDEWGGICGDIHFAGLMIGQMTRPDEFEFFTASYVSNGTQHVYLFAIDKENPDQAVVLNYDAVNTVKNINGIESLSVRNDNKGDFNNIGTRVRIFAQNKKTSEHVATVQTAIGSFIYNARTREHERLGIPGYQDISSAEVNLGRTKTSGVKEIASGVKVLYGRRDQGVLGSTDIVTLAYYRYADQNTDGTGNVENSKKIGRDSNLAIMATAVSQGNILTNEEIYLMHLNYTMGIYKTIFRSDKVDIQAKARMNVAAEFYLQESEEGVIKPASGDGDLQTGLGINARYSPSESDHFDFNVEGNHAVGLYEQRSMFSWKRFPTNIRFTPNTVRASANYLKNLTPATSASVGANYLGSQVGGIFNIESTLRSNQHIIYVNYQTPATGINRNISSNLLPNATKMVTAGYQNNAVQIGNQKLGVNGGVTYLPEYNRFAVQAGLRLKLNQKSSGKK